MAEEIPSKQTLSSFEDAVSAWLSGDDDAALNALAELARKNDPEAQVLLGRIAGRGHFYAHVTRMMPRKKRIALLRKPGGLSGISWLEAAKGSAPLAGAFLRAGQPETLLDAVVELIALGETDTALLAMQAAVDAGGGADLLDAIQPFLSSLPVEATAPIDAAKAQTSHTPAVTNGGKTAITMGWRALKLKNLGQNLTNPDMMALGKSTRGWRPMRLFCEESCKGSPDICTVFAVTYLKPYGPFPMRSPAQSLISNETYWASDRMTCDLARLTRDVRTIQTRHEPLDSCYMREMRAAQARCNGQN